MNIFCHDSSARPCGCPRDSISDIRHWWKYTKLRYWWRVARATPRFVKAKLKAKFFKRLCRWMNDDGTELAVGLGVVDVSEALSCQRRWQSLEEAWHEIGKMVIGADGDHPDGIEVKSPADLVCMTSDECNHWFRKG
jgi:hypothetical protein